MGIKKFILSLILVAVATFGFVEPACSVTEIKGAPGTSVDVNIQDQTTPIVDLYMHVHRAGTITITEDTTRGSYTYSITSTLLPVVGNLVCLKEAGEYYQGAVLSFTGSNPYVLTMDTPLDYAFTTDGGCSLVEHDIATSNGSSTPVIYHIRPPVGQKWDIVRVLFHIEDATAMDDGLFGGGAALTRGVVLRVVNGTWENIFNVKTNGEFAERAYDREYVTKPPAGTGHALNVRRTFGGPSKNGVVIRLDGDTDEELQLIIQDDLTHLDHFHAIAQGHVVHED